MYSFRPLPLVKGCRRMAYHLTVHTVMHRKPETLVRQRHGETERQRQTNIQTETGGGGGGGRVVVVNWCFTPNQAVRLYQRERERRIYENRERSITTETDRDTDRQTETL